MEKDQHKTSVIIVTKNRPQELLKCLDSVKKAIRAYDEIIIVENGSNNLLHMKWKDKRIRYFHRSNPSRVEARNFGIQVAQGEIVAFIDDDSIVSPHWLQNLLDTYEQYPEGGSVGGKVLGIRAWAHKFAPRSLGPPGGKITAWGSVIRNLQAGEEVVETDVLSGGNMSFKRNLLLKIGGFDTTYDARTSAYREENDPQIRIRRLGYKLLYQPKALVYHFASEKGRKKLTVKEHAKPRMRNHTYFYLKNFLLQNPLLILLIPLFLLDIFLMLLIRYKNPLAFYYGFSGFLEAVSGFKDRIKRDRSQQRFLRTLFSQQYSKPSPLCEQD